MIADMVPTFGSVNMIGGRNSTGEALEDSRDPLSLGKSQIVGP